MKDILYTVYSHTEYLDVLKVQVEHMKPVQNKVLLINGGSHIPDEILREFKKVIFYDDKLPYASRLLSLKNLDEEYILFMHDIDILLSRDQELINELPSIMKKENIDGLDLKVKLHQADWKPYEIYSEVRQRKIQLRKQTDPKSQNIYVQQPFVWKLSSFMGIMENFPQEAYRSIEYNVQEYASTLNIYKLFPSPECRIALDSDEYICCSRFDCLDFFQYLHVTIRGKLYFPGKISYKIRPHFVNVINKLKSTRDFETFY